MRKRIKLGLILALVSMVMVSLAACRGQTAESQILTAVVKRGDIVQRVSADGSLSLIRDRKLTFETSGKIAEINVEEGSSVVKGQVLAKLETTSLERAVKTAELAVKLAGADLKQAEQNIKAAEIDRTQAENNVKVAEIDRTQAENNVKAAEADLKQVQLGIEVAEIDLELASNNFQKIIVPYPYLTYQFVIPESVDAIRVAEQRIKEAQAEFQKAIKGEPYSLAEIQDLLAKTKDILSETGTRLGWGLDAGTRPANADYWTLRALQLQVDKARSALDNAENLVDKAGLAVDSAKNVLNKAQVAVDNARSVFNKAVVAVDNARNAFDKAQLAVDKAKYDLDSDKEALDKVAITAPFDGVIAKVNVKVGDTLSSVNYATTTAFEIIDLSRMELTVKVDEIDIPNVKPGQKVAISVDALPDEKLEGVVTSISPLPEVEAGVVSYKVKAGFDVPKGLVLKTGMSATADIIIDKRSNVLLVPNRAIKKDSQGKTAVEVLVDGKSQERPVVTGISDGFQTEIKEGLSEGEVVVEARVKSETSGGLLGGGNF